MIRSEVIDLLLPARAPKILAYKLDGVKGVGEKPSIMTQTWRTG